VVRQKRTHRFYWRRAGLAPLAFAFQDTARFDVSRALRLSGGAVARYFAARGASLK